MFTFKSLQRNSLLTTFYEWRNWDGVKQRVSIGWEDHLWVPDMILMLYVLVTPWPCFDIWAGISVESINRKETGDSLNLKKKKKKQENVVKHLFTFPMKSLIRSQSPPQTDINPLSLLAPFLSTTYPPSICPFSLLFSCPLFPIRFPSLSWWAMKDYSDPIYLCRKLGGILSLQNKTLPNKHFLECWLVLKAQILTLNWLFLLVWPSRHTPNNLLAKINLKIGYIVNIHAHTLKATPRRQNVKNFQDTCSRRTHNLFSLLVNLG